MRTERETQEVEADETKVEVRGVCATCEGKGVRHGRECEVCGGARKVTRQMTLYQLATVVVKEMLEGKGKEKNKWR